MKISIFIAFLTILLGLFVTPKTMEVTIAQADIPMQDVEPDSNNSAGNQTADSRVEQMSLRAQLKPHDNKFFADEGWYQLKKFGFVASNGSEICASNNCKYGVENGQFSPLTNMSGRYLFEGKLKVTTMDQDVKKSKLYNFEVYLDKTGEEERNGQSFETLQGTFGLGRDTLKPDISYVITNATLEANKKNPILSIHGESSGATNANLNDYKATSNTEDSKELYDECVGVAGKSLCDFLFKR